MFSWTSGWERFPEDEEVPGSCGMGMPGAVGWGCRGRRYLCLSCRCRAGCSCRARHSTCRSRGTPAPRSPRRPQRSCRVGSPASSRIAGGTRERVRAPAPPHALHPEPPTLYIQGSHQASVVGPLEVLLHDPVIEPDPGVLVPEAYGERHPRLARWRQRAPRGADAWRAVGWGVIPPPRTIDEAMLLPRVDAGEVAGAAAAVPLRILPGAPAGKVPVAVTLELVPVVVAALRVCGEMGTVGTARGTGPPSTPGLLHPLPSSPRLPPKGQGLGSVPMGVSPTPW